MSKEKLKIIKIIDEEQEVRLNLKGKKEAVDTIFNLIDELTEDLLDTDYVYKYKEGDLEVIEYKDMVIFSTPKTKENFFFKMYGGA